jgi:acyl-CoA synthetase (AMP-forming)/AMP-acid ligase II
VLPGREVAARPDPVGRGRYSPAFGEPALPIYPLDGDELMAWVAGRVAPYKRIREVRFVEAVPRTPSGKLLRRVLIEQEQQMA